MSRAERSWRARSSRRCRRAANRSRSLLDLLFERLVPKTFNTAGPGYLAYIPGGGLFHSAVADFIAASINRYVGVWLPAPGLVQLEVNVIRWFCSLLGLPPVPAASSPPAARWPTSPPW